MANSNMTDIKRSVLITGCSDGGMGAALAIAFQNAGLHVYATARDTSKMQSLNAIPGVELLQLDIQSESSIADCASKISSLDILINNAGAAYTMPISDISLPEAKKLFDLNVWGHIAVTQAFLPLLIESKKQPIIANHTSVGAGLAIPFQATYNASKAAFSMFSQSMRMELQGFGISVVELKTGGVRTNVIKNLQAKQPSLPENSIYAPAKELVEKSLRNEFFDIKLGADQWAKEVVGDLLKSKPPPVIWRGESAWMAWVGQLFPFGSFDGMVKKMTRLDKVEGILLAQKR